MKPRPAFFRDLAAVGLLLVAGAGCVGDASSGTPTEPTEGSCGSANGTATSSAPAAGLCGAGTASTVSGSGPWTWTCAGSSGGATANCSAGVATGPALAITTASLPSGLVGSAYSATLGATGGSQPYAWSATETLPAWLTLSPTGVLSGTPAAAGTVTLKFQVVDSVSATSSVTLSLTITALPPFFSGCAAPPGAPSGRIYYSDPVNGTMSNDGSQSKPWGSLSAIIAAKKLPPDNGAAVQPGDAIYLMTGGHGDVSLNASNTDFITVAAAPGQTPTLSRLTMDGASHWILRGLTVQALNSGYSIGMRVGGSDLVLDGNAVLSQPDVSAWTQTDWQTKALFYAINASGNCISLLGNHITNVGFAIGISGTNILVHGNTIDHFGDDGIDFGQGTGSGTISNIEISGNVITNNLDIGDSNHNDGIQGWVLNGTTGHDVTIDSNVVIVKTDPNLPWKGGMQGISEFDGAWTHIQITNNLVVAAAYHGVALYGAQDSTIINNSVYGSFTAPNADVDQTWIGVFDNGGTHPSNVIVRNNVSSIFSLSNIGVTADHNITSTNPASLFVAFDRAKNLYDLHPASGSALIGAGSPELAPALDIAGAPRTPPITVGAYQ